MKSETEVRRAAQAVGLVGVDIEHGPLTPEDTELIAMIRGALGFAHWVLNVPSDEAAVFQELLDSAGEAGRDLAARN